MSVPGADPQQLIKKIGRALLGAMPQNWKQVRAEYRAAGRHIEVDVLVTEQDGQPYPIRPPRDVVEQLGELRVAMYRPGRGTWMSGLYVLDHPSKYSAEFEPDVEPQWRRVPPPIGFQDELRRFPREDAHVPEWLRMRAGLPPAGDSTPTPPGGTPVAQMPQPDGPPKMPSGPLPAPNVALPQVPPGNPQFTPSGSFPSAPSTPPGGFPTPPAGSAPGAGAPNTPSGGFPTPRPGGFPGQQRPGPPDITPQ